MTLKQFKRELKGLLPSDKWGESIGTFFTLCSELHHRGEYVPNEWEYSPGMCSGDIREPSDYFFELFEPASTEQLLEIGHFLHRYTNMLRHMGKDY